MGSNLNIGNEILNLLTGLGHVVIAYDNKGNRVTDPQRAVRFAVDDTRDDTGQEHKILVRIDAKDNAPIITLTVNKSNDELQKQLKMLVNNTIGPAGQFEYKIFGKTLKHKENNEQLGTYMADDVMEGFGAMTGGIKTSYQPLDTVKIIVKHKKPVNEEIRGSRSRNIHSIFIQNGKDRFKMQENSLKAARAMARHIHNGGEMSDSVGTAITELAVEYRTLREFVKYVRGVKLINEQNEQYISLAIENINNIRSMFEKLASVNTYAVAVESLSDRNSVEILEDDVDLSSKFVETHFDSRVSNAMESIKRAISRQRAYESAIQAAIKKETFENLKNLLQENDMLDFSTPHAKLGYQVAQMGQAAQDQRLGTCLSDISKKLYAGQSMNQFEYATVKSCLLSANEARLKESSNKAPPYRTPVITKNDQGDYEVHAYGKLHFTHANYKAAMDKVREINQAAGVHPIQSPSAKKLNTANPRSRPPR